MSQPLPRYLNTDPINRQDDKLAPIIGYAETERKLGRILLEVGEPAPPTPTANPAALITLVDAQLVRGIPAVGGRGSIGGATTGTRPGDRLA